MLASYASVGNARIYLGDCLEVLKQLEPNSVDCVVTSPPYAMQRKSTYGGIPEAEYPAWAVSVFDAIRHVLKPDGSILWNISPHVKNSTLADYVLRSRLALRDAGWFEHDELIWIKPNQMPTGRSNWPVRAWESVFWYSLSRTPFCDARATGSKVQNIGTSRSNFQGRARRTGWDHMGKPTGTPWKEYARSKNYVTISSGDVARACDHPAPYPKKFSDWLVKMFCPPDGTVLDPFAGSGTTLVSALSLGRSAIGVDAVPEYVDMMWTRLVDEQSLLDEE